MRQTAKGVCLRCQRELSKAGMIRHLETCLPKAEQAEQAQPGQIFHLFVEAYRSPLYWLHLEIATGTTLATLDRFLRDIWLEERCGHLSAFQIGHVHYSLDQELFGDRNWTPRHQSMEREMSKVLSPALTFSYDYDFGSTTELRLRVMAVRDVKNQEQTIRVLARNTSLDVVPCAFCGQPSTSFCEACILQGKGYLCTICAESHACGRDMVSPRVNSPREGVCGYTGQDRVPAY